MQRDWLHQPVHLSLIPSQHIYLKQSAPLRFEALMSTFSAWASSNLKPFDHFWFASFFWAKGTIFEMDRSEVWHKCQEPSRAQACSWFLSFWSVLKFFALCSWSNLILWSQGGYTIHFHTRKFFSFISQSYGPERSANTGSPQKSFFQDLGAETDWNKTVRAFLSGLLRTYSTGNQDERHEHITFQKVITTSFISSSLLFLCPPPQSTQGSSRYVWWSVKPVKIQSLVLLRMVLWGSL